MHHLNNELKKLGCLKLRTEEKEKLELEAQITSLSLPGEQAIDKILRYETAIERKLYRAMDQLERLQRQRKGEPVPPLEVSSET